ncbi:MULTISPECIES: glycosyltransferase family 2 protein [unclassified Oceanobacter]|uniref:glycosyltransferase family 2 protein n=1 Tax=unclassified Oceanobacter TaxID=2620260 RepID=UPI00273734EA|nr:MULTISPECIES: glycosyltransferase family 2 protein [unclassified Oceanobacter]MDP2608085.1 glycosyltransferase family 2 protein [Oceanobacter sp. 1_MG-2023]MDP2611253.1 glycosyltransferase family 2 protein [Oceanobacter sp. 2_MG-2023]
MITVIILTYNEAVHIERCISSVALLGARIVVVDSFSSDGTEAIARSMHVDFYKNKFINQSFQFQWAMDNCDIRTEWVLRLDADETIDADLVINIRKFIENDGFGNNAAVFQRKHIFLGKWVKHGGRYPLPMLRLFRRGCAHVEQRWMDEHIVLDSGTSTVLKGGFSDDNLNSVGWFIDKHNKYATREMVDIKLHELYETGSEITSCTSTSIKLKRLLKERLYMGLPYFVRPVLYFLYRYFIQLGFLDGARGFAYHFMQGLWYRALVDLKCMEVDRIFNGCQTIEEKHQKLEEYSGFGLEKPIE